MDKENEIELMYQVKKMMKQKCEEEVKIHNARKHWNKIRRNKRVFQMMYRIGEEHVMTLINERRNR